MLNGKDLMYQIIQEMHQGPSTDYFLQALQLTFCYTIKNYKLQITYFYLQSQYNRLKFKITAPD